MAESAIVSELKAFQSRVDEKIIDSNDKVTRALKRLDTVEELVSRPVLDGLPMAPESKGLAHLISQTAEWQAWARTGKGRFALKVSGPEWMSAKTVITSGDIGYSTPGILTPARVPGIVKPGVRSLRVRELMPNFPTVNSAVEFVKENAYTNAASPQVEASAKAESALTFTIESAPVRTLAHWIPASTQVLSDFAALRGYIDQRLLDGLRDVEDAQLLAGDGTGQNIEGLIPQATAYNTGLNVTGDTRIDRLNHAIAQLEASNFTPDGIVLHPTDWRKVQLLKTEEGGSNKGSYLIGSPTSDALPRLWGLNIALTTAMTVGYFLIGAFRTAAAVWDRLEAVVEVSTEHSDYFVKNLIAIRCEERLALTVYQPLALVYGSFA